MVCAISGSCGLTKHVDQAQVYDCHPVFQQYLDHMTDTDKFAHTFFFYFNCFTNLLLDFCNAISSLHGVVKACYGLVILILILIGFVESSNSGI